ncbi:MAG: c-type cytochrome [Parvularculaceae bacterium]
MKPLKIAAITAAALGGLALASYAAVWLLGERIIARKYSVPAISITHSTDAAVIDHGRRMSEVAGCRGCHSADLNGKLFGEARFVYRMTTANLPRLAATYSDEDFARSIRHGVKPNGRSVIGMPSPAFYDMRHEDLSAIISYIRTMPDKGERLPRSETWILGRIEFLQGLYPPEASTIDHNAPQRIYDFSNQLELGEYLARIACSECHGINFEGAPEGPGPGLPPDLTIAAAYPSDAFAHLLRTGEPLGGRDLELMDDVARDRFIHFTDEEVEAIHAFLVDRAMKAAQ